MSVRSIVSLLDRNGWNEIRGRAAAIFKEGLTERFEHFPRRADAGYWNWNKYKEISRGFECVNLLTSHEWEREMQLSPCLNELESEALWFVVGVLTTNPLGASQEWTFLWSGRWILYQAFKLLKQKCVSQRRRICTKHMFPEGEKFFYFYLLALKLIWRGYLT